MKKTFLALVMACGLLLTGCAQLTELSDKQSDVIAEYMAGSVLRYTDNYMEGLIYPDENANKKTADKNTSSATAADTAKDTGSDVNNNETNSSSQNENVSDKDASVKDNSTANTAKEPSSLTYQEFYKILSNNNYQVKYSGYKFYDSYAQRNDYFTLQPSSGSKLLVVSFKVSNIAKKAVTLDLGQLHIGYKLHLANGKTYKPMVTLLDTDLNYIDYTLKSGKSDVAVLVFDVPENVNKSGLALSISLNGQNTEINLNE